ncbi:hypothetical protein E5676_scaffold194G00030 [Cucumis melo var. makuwa]|uniref:Reverse transcriptase n=1 Tax=Cucumis melo var. makuwa TaxID=1194695 RepID=A0A5D3BDZ2_CUCMM|nr:hypothetical protein E6C27_scaffold340G00030 [Cucumis melo var. makuwa]TYJ97216.1 hypothetical protein E5676_scaffold194G00030 [Cucumis melo var. makuwa]
MASILRGSPCKVDNSFKKQFDLLFSIIVSSEESAGTLNAYDLKLDSETEGANLSIPSTFLKDCLEFEGFLVGKDDRSPLLQFADRTLLFYKYDEKMLLKLKDAISESSRLQGRKAIVSIFRSTVRRLSLAKGALATIMSSLPTYYLSLFSIPENVAASLEKIMWNFFWEGYAGSKINHLVNWNKVSSPLKNESKEFWVSIARVWRSVDSLALFKLGNGHRIGFPTDLWVGNAPLKEQFFKLFKIAILPNGSVAAHWDFETSSWSLSFRRCLKDDEIAEFQSLLSQLSSEKVNNYDDYRSWSIDHHDRFTVKFRLT